MDKITCDQCKGSRLRTESLNFKINGKNIADLAGMDIIELTQWFANIDKELSATQHKNCK